MTAGPIFVVGSMRSGSTMLRLILDSHPNIAIGPETGFMSALLSAKDIPNWQFGKGWYKRLNWTEEELDERLHDFYSGIFGRYAAEQGKRRWGEKTPFHTAHMAAMAQVFPEAVFVGIVRHPGGVAASLQKRFHYTFADAVSYWRTTNLDLARAGTELHDRFLLCRYEDLVSDSQHVLRELIEFLGEPWSANLLAHHAVQREKGAPRSVEGSTVTRDPIDPRRADQWAGRTTLEDRQALQVAAELAGFFGYDALEPAIREPLGPTTDPSHWTVTGEDLARRRSAWADRIDFAERPVTPMIDAPPEELAARLLRVEQALARTRSRRLVRMGDAFRRVQRGRSVQDLRDAWSVLRGPRSDTRQ